MTKIHTLFFCPYLCSRNNENFYEQDNNLFIDHHPVGETSPPAPSPKGEGGKGRGVREECRIIPSPLLFSIEERNEEKGSKKESMSKWHTLFVCIVMDVLFVCAEEEHCYTVALVDFEELVCSAAAFCLDAAWVDLVFVYKHVLYCCSTLLCQDVVAV